MILALSLAANVVLFVVCALLYRTSVRLARRSSRVYTVQVGRRRWWDGIP